MYKTINKHLKNYALDRCSQAANPYIFEDLANGKKIYMGFTIKYKPKKNKCLSFYGVDIHSTHIKYMKEYVFNKPVKDVIPLSHSKNPEPIYYVTTDTMCAIIYVFKKDAIKHDFSSESIVEIYISLLRNQTFNYNYLCKEKILTILSFNDVNNLIGSTIGYHPIQNDRLNTSITIKTGLIKKVTSIPYSNNVYIATFEKNNQCKTTNGIVFMNSRYSDTREMLLHSNGNYCMLCGEYHKNVQWHHILPRSLDGSNNYYNGSLLCPKCHKFVHDYQKTHGNISYLTSSIIDNKYRIGAIAPKMRKEMLKLLI